MTAGPSAPPRPPVGPSGRTAVLVGLAAVLVVMLAVPVRAWFLQQAKLADVRAELAATSAQIRGLQQERQDWLDDAYVQEQARQRLNYVLPGEAGVVVLQPENGDTATDGAQPRTWYEGLWQTVESASGRGATAVGDPVQVRPSAPR